MHSIWSITTWICVRVSHFNPCAWNANATAAFLDACRRGLCRILRVCMTLCTIKIAPIQKKSEKQQYKYLRCMWVCIAATEWFHSFIPIISFSQPGWWALYECHACVCELFFCLILWCTVLFRYRQLSVGLSVVRLLARVLHGIQNLVQSWATFCCVLIATTNSNTSIGIRLI